MCSNSLRSWIELKPKQMAPYSAGVYAFVVDGQILYIGSTWCLRNRCSNHPVKRFLKRECIEVSIYYQEVPEYSAYEKQLILMHKPKLNKQYLLSPKKGVKPKWQDLIKKD